MTLAEMNELFGLLKSSGFEIDCKLDNPSGYYMRVQKIPNFKGWRKVCRILKNYGVGFQHKSRPYSILGYRINSSVWDFEKPNRRKQYTVLETQLTEDMTKMIPELKSVIERNN